MTLAKCPACTGCMQWRQWEVNSNDSGLLGWMGLVDICTLHTVHTMCSNATMSSHFAICMHIIRERVCLESFANFSLCRENIANFSSLFLNYENWRFKNVTDANPQPWSPFTAILDIDFLFICICGDISEGAFTIYTGQYPSGSIGWMYSPYTFNQ